MVFEELEPRVLLSADLPFNLPGALADEPDEEESVPALETSAAFVETPELARVQELVFVDTDTPDYRKLVDDLIQNNGERLFEVVLLDNASNGVTQISNALKQHSGLDAVHIVSHGSEGSVSLGGSRLDFDTLTGNIKAIHKWSRAFSEDGDLLVYGCNLAASEEGQALVRSLATLTGTDVAASDDPTGHADLGADWDLEYRVGDVEADVAFGAEVRQDWHASLVQPNITARETVDADSDGQIDRIKVTTDQNLDDDFSGLTITVSGYSVTGYSSGTANDNIFFADLTESGTPDSDTTPEVAVTANTTLSEDGGSNNIATDAGTAATDTAAPVILSKETADLDNDGSIDAIHITFSEAIDDSTVTASDWDVAGVTGEAFSSTTNGDTADDADIYITFNDGVLDTGATPDVTYTQGTLADAAANLLASDAAVVAALAWGDSDSGMVTYANPANGDDSASDIVLDSSGNVYAVGRTWNGTDNDIVVRKYDANGDLDTTWGDGDTGMI